MLRPSLAILFLSVALGACEGVNGGVVGDALSSGAPPASGQNWVCGQEYVNHAWGYQRRGAVVDISGTVWRHTTQGGPAAGDQMWQPKDVSRLTEETVGQRYKGATPDATKVPAAQMA